MIRIAVFLVAVLLVGAGAYYLLRETPEAQHCPLDDTREAPSGRALSLCNVLYEVQPDGSVWSVVRVLDPGLVPNTGQDDHDWACAIWGIGSLDKEPRPVRMVIQIMTAPFERGEPAPGITQSIEAYSEIDGACRWELL